MALKPVDDTIDYLLSVVSKTAATEVRSLGDALNCCLAEDLVSPVNVPPADNSAMDGYAIAHASVQGNEWLNVSDRIAAGHSGQALLAGTAARIFTGAEIPVGADTVVIQENIESRQDEVLIHEMPEAGDNVRAKGQDIQSGETIVVTGDRITPGCLGLIASIGISRVKVFTPLKVAIMSTGDELVEPGGKLEPGQIFNSNRYALGGLLTEMGMQVVDLGIVADTPEATEQALINAAQQADCILTSGGVSVGEEDHVKAAVEELGSLNLWKLAIKPGKPLAYGDVEGVPFFGLPGNPVSTFVTFMIVARPYLLSMQGYSNVDPGSTYAEAGFDFQAGGRREYLRVTCQSAEDGRVIVEKFPNQGSGIMTSIVWADALAEVDVQQTVSAGDRLKIYPLSRQ